MILVSPVLSCPVLVSPIPLSCCSALLCVMSDITRCVQCDLVFLVQSCVLCLFSCFRCGPVSVSLVLFWVSSGACPVCSDLAMFCPVFGHICPVLIMDRFPVPRVPAFGGSGALSRPVRSTPQYDQKGSLLVPQNPPVAIQLFSRLLSPILTWETSAPDSYRSLSLVYMCFPVRPPPVLSLIPIVAQILIN